MIVQNGKQGFVDTAGNVVIEPKFNLVYSFVHAYAYAKNNDGEWFINKKGEICFERLGQYDGGFAAVMKDGKWGFINENGEIVVNLIYEEVRFFAENGKAKVKKNGKWLEIQLAD